MRQAKLEDTVKLLKEKLQTEDGKLSDPKTLTAWTNNFSNIPEFTSIRRSAQQSGEVRNTQGKIFVLLSLLGYKLYRDGHVRIWSVVL